MADIELRHLRLVTSLAECGTLTRAAARLHVTQPALSQRLRELEDGLQTPLFLRQGKVMTPTPAGERLVASAQRLLAELERVTSDVRAFGSGERGLLRIATQCYTCYHWLPAKVSAFRRRFPSVAIEIITTATEDPFTHLLDGKLDLAIVHTPIRHPRIRYEPLFRDELVLIVDPEHRLASRRFVTPDSLANEHVLHAVSRERNLALRQILDRGGVVPRHVTHVHLTEALIEMVKAGLGVGIIARWAVRPQIESGKLRALRLGPRGFIRLWSAALRKTETVSPFVGPFLQLLRRGLK